jgi:glycerophosphoryl diester phosphodiesterase
MMEQVLQNGTLLLAAGLMAMAIAPGTSTSAEPKRPEIIAHRGASFVAPENTVAAYKLAWEMDADAAETDVHLTSDNKVVVMHDGSAKRTAGLDVAVKDVTLDELRKLDAGSWKDPKYAGEPIPTLEEVIATIPPGKQLFIEIKSDATIAPYLKEVIEKSGKKDQITIISFGKDALIAAHKAMPDVPTKWLLGAPKDENDKPMPIDVAKVQEAKEAGFDGLNVSFYGVSPELVKASKDADMELYIWTLNDTQVALKMADMGVAGITTDKPDVMLKLFEAQSKADELKARADKKSAEAREKVTEAKGKAAELKEKPASRPQIEPH